MERPRHALLTVLALIRGKFSLFTILRSTLFCGRSALATGDRAATLQQSLRALCNERGHPAAVATSSGEWARRRRLTQ